MGLFSSSKSQTTQVADNRAYTAGGENSLVSVGNTITTSDPDVVKNALLIAKDIANGARQSQESAFAIAQQAQRDVAGAGTSAVNAVLQAKTDAGQSERLIKIIAIAGVAALAAIMLLRKG